MHMHPSQAVRAQAYASITKRTQSRVINTHGVLGFPDRVGLENLGSGRWSTDSTVVDT